MNADHAIAIAHLCLLFAAAVAWLTAGAQLADMHPGGKIITKALRATAAACLALYRTGWHSIDSDAWKRSFRPMVRAVVAAFIFACAPAAAAELIFGGRIGVFGAALCLCLSVGVAIATPCPWIRFVLFGDRRQGERPFDGDNRRAE
jgi:hypothetical protein